MKPHLAKTDFDVIQIGYGPVSKFSALLLDRMGWRVGVFERWHEVYPLPRAVCIDHEIHRVLHAAGLGPIVEKITAPAPVYRWFNADWQQLLAIDWTAGSVSGGTEVNFVHQPSFERELDAEAKRRSNIDLHFETEAIAIRQDDDVVTVTVRDSKTGETRDWTCRYLLGIDGANSIVRESLGITRTDLGFQADWLVVDFLQGRADRQGTGPDRMRPILQPETPDDHRTGRHRGRPDLPPLGIHAPAARNPRGDGPRGKGPGTSGRLDQARPGHAGAPRALYLPVAGYGQVARRAHPAGRGRRASDAAVHGPGHVRRAARCLEPCLEARQRPERRRTSRCSTPMNPNASPMSAT